MMVKEVRVDLYFATGRIQCLHGSNDDGGDSDVGNDDGNNNNELQ